MATEYRDLPWSTCRPSLFAFDITSTSFWGVHGDAISANDASPRSTIDKWDTRPFSCQKWEKDIQKRKKIFTAKHAEIVIATRSFLPIRDPRRNQAWQTKHELLISKQSAAPFTDFPGKSKRDVYLRGREKKKSRHLHAMKLLRSRSLSRSLLRMNNFYCC